MSGPGGQRGCRPCRHRRSALRRAIGAACHRRTELRHPGCQGARKPATTTSQHASTSTIDRWATARRYSRSPMCPDLRLRAIERAHWHVVVVVKLRKKGCEASQSRPTAGPALHRPRDGRPPLRGEATLHREYRSPIKKSAVRPAKFNGLPRSRSSASAAGRTAP